MNDRLRNLKQLIGDGLYVVDGGAVAGAILARAHARSTDAAKIAGYCGKSSVLDKSLALWAEAYANQTQLDHAALVKAVKNDRRVQALLGK